MLTRYNMYPAAAINGNAAPGISSGQAIDLMEKLAKRELPPGRWRRMDRAGLPADCRPATRPCSSSPWRWCWCSWCWRRSTKAGRCRWRSSWSCRCACLCSIAGVLIAKMDINIFTQIGFVVLVGLACKNAILIVEFAKARARSRA